MFFSFRGWESCRKRGRRNEQGRIIAKGNTTNEKKDGGRGASSPRRRRRRRRRRDLSGNAHPTTHGIRDSLVKAVQYRRASHHIPQSAPVSTAVIQHAVELDLPPAAGGAQQSLPQTIQSTEGHPQHVRYARIREHRRDYAPSLLVVIEVIRLPIRG